MTTRREGTLYSVACVAILIAAVTTCNDGPTVPKGAPGLHIVSAASGTDTITAILADPLAVVVVDSSGRPAAGRVVRFETVPADARDSVEFFSHLTTLAREGTTQFRSLVVDTTDADGYAAVRVQLARLVGPSIVVIRVADAGYADTARYTVKVGAADRMLVTPADSAAYVGQGYVLHARVIDRGGNSRPQDPIVFSVITGPATVDRTTGALTATAIGRANILIQSNAISATAWLSVVPRGWVAAQQHVPGNGGPLGIFLMGLDGSGRQPLAAGLDNAWTSGQGFGWSPDGRDLAIARGDSVDLVSPGTAERRVLAAGGPVYLGARFSRDGEWIYFARAGSGLHRVRRDGTGLQHLGRGGTEWGDDYRPAPSHDGLSVVYGSYRSPCGQEDCIRVLDIATNADRIYDGTRDFLVRGTNAAWSPTEDLIAYSSGSTVALIRSDGLGQTVLATDVGHVGWMDFSPDGNWLLVSPGVGPVLLFDIRSGAQLPISSLTSYGAAAWRP